MARQYVRNSASEYVPPEDFARLLADPAWVANNLNWPQTDFETFRDRYVAGMTADGSIQAQLQQQMAETMGAPTWPAPAN